MTSTNDGKDVKSNQTSGQESKSYYIELYTSLEKALSGDGSLEERTGHVCEAWRRVYSLYQHSLTATHPHLLSWLQRHTANIVLQSKWGKSKNEQARLTNAIDALVAEATAAAAGRDHHPWEKTLLQRAAWFRKALENPWDNPVLKSLINPNSEPVTDQQVLEWLISEHGIVLVTRLQRMAGAGNCDDLALLLASAVMDRARASIPHRADDCADERVEMEDPSSFVSVLEREASFTAEEWEMLTDIELVLLLKTDKRPRCIELAKLTPLRHGYKMVERLRRRLEFAPRDKKLWKHAKEVATLVAQVVIARCMVLRSCAGAGRDALYWCARALARLVGGGALRTVSTALAAPAATARHLHTFCAALSAECKELKTDVIMKPFICELYVRAITAGMNELEQLKLNAEKESEARSYEQTLAGWFTQLGGRLTDSARLRAECALTAFSVHPALKLYERVASTPQPAGLQQAHEPTPEATSDYGSWANDSRTQSNLVKTSETLQLKQSQQHQANVLSTAILTEGEALGLEPELCQDLAVLLSGPRVKTLSWDMDREVLLENCRAYMEKTHGGTRAVTTELKYLNLDPDAYRHLPEEGDDENDLFYGIEKGYEHEVQFEEPEDIWQNAFLDPEQTESANDSEVERQFKLKSKSHTSEDDEDPLSNIAEAKREKEKISKDKNKERRKKSHKRDESKDGSRERRKDKDKKTKKERKKDKSEQPTTGSLISLLGMKVSKMSARVQDGEKRVRKKKERRREPKTMFSYVSVTDSEYDSQGKSSQVSEHDPNVLVDGVFSMDELKSPERTVDTQTPIDNTKVIKNNATVQSPVINDSKTKPIKSPIVSTASEDSDVSRAKSPYLTPNQLGARHVVSSKVKSSISKLLQFRRNKSQARAVPRPPPSHTPTTPTQSLVGMKIYNPEEVPKVSVTKKQNKQLEALSKEVSDLIKEANINSNYRATPEINNRLQNQNSHNVQKHPQQYNNPQCMPHSDTLKHGVYPRHSPVRPIQQNVPHQSPISVIQTNYSSPIKTPEHIGTHPLNLTPTKPPITYQPFHKSMQNLSTDTKCEPPKKPQLINDPNYFTLQHVKTNTSQLSPRIISNTCIKPPSQAPSYIQQYSSAGIEPKSPQTYSNLHRTYTSRGPAPSHSQLSNSKTDVIRYGQKLSTSMQNINELPAQHDANKLDIGTPKRRQAVKPCSVSQSDGKTTQSFYGSNSSASRCLPVQQREKARIPHKPNINDDFDEYLKKLVESISASNGHDKNRTISLNKDVKVSHVPSASAAKRVDSVSPQCAKQLIQQKKVDNAPNTFSRLSYMHKNKQSEKVNIMDSITLELNKTMMAHKMSKAKCMKNEVTISRVGPNTQDQSVIRKLEQPCSRSQKDCPILSSMLDHTTPKVQTVSNIPISNTSGNQVNREDADLLLLLRNQPSLKTSVSNVETSVSDAASGLIINPQIKEEPQVSSAHQGLVGTKVKNIDVLDSSPLKKETEDNKSLEWKFVMDAIIAQKTEPLGPNALELALKKDYRRHSQSSRSHSIDKHQISRQTFHNKPLDPKKREYHSSKAKTSRKLSPEKHSEVPKKPREPDIIKKPKEIVNKPEINKHFNPMIPKNYPQTPVVTNSDYDNLDDLLDDDLRRELGEISSDEDAYDAPNAAFLKGKTQSNFPKSPTNVCKGTNILKENHIVNPKPISKNETNSNIVDYNRKSAVNTCPTGYPNVINNSSHPLIEIKPTAKPEARHTATSTIISNQVAQDTANNIVTGCMEATQFIANVRPANVIIASVPSSPVVVIRQDLVYDPYPTIRIHESQVNAELCSINQNMYALNTTPNIAVYQTTQYAAPVINPVIIGNAMTTTNVSNATAIGNDHETLDCAKDMNIQDQDTISLEDAIRLTDVEKGAPETNKKNREGGIRQSDDKSQTLEISTNLDFNMNRNCERKVLSQVQEKQPNDDVDKDLNRSPVNDSTLNTEDDRIKLKRQSLINRKIIHAGYHPPIPLTYTPLDKNDNLGKQLHHELTLINGSVKPYLKSVPNTSDIEKGVVISTSVEGPQFEANNENIESADQVSNAKENQKTSRRIWLRSSNKIRNKMSPVKRPRVPLRRNKIKLKVIKAIDDNVADVECKNKDSVKNPTRVSNRILSKVKLIKTATIQPPSIDASRQNIAESDDLIDFEKALRSSIVLKNPITTPITENTLKEEKNSYSIDAEKERSDIEDGNVTSHANKTSDTRLEPKVVIEKLKSEMRGHLTVKSSSAKTTKEAKVIIIKNQNRPVLRKKAIIKKYITSKEATPNKIILKAAPKKTATASSVPDNANKLKPVVKLEQKVIKAAAIGSPLVRVETNKLVDQKVIEQISAAVEGNDKSKPTVLQDKKGDETNKFNLPIVNQNETKSISVASSLPAINTLNKINQMVAKDNMVIKPSIVSSSPHDIENSNEVVKPTIVGDEKIIKQTTNNGATRIADKNNKLVVDDTNQTAAVNVPLDLDECSKLKLIEDGLKNTKQSEFTPESLSNIVQKKYDSDFADCKKVSSELEKEKISKLQQGKNSPSQSLTTATAALDIDKTFRAAVTMPSTRMSRANTIVELNRSVNLLNSEDSKLNVESASKESQNLSPKITDSVNVNHVAVTKKNREEVIDISQTDDLQSPKKNMKSNVEITNKDQQMDTGNSLLCPENINEVLDDETVIKTDVQDKQNGLQIQIPHVTDIPKHSNVNSRPNDNSNQYRGLKPQVETAQQQNPTNVTNTDNQTYMKTDIKIEELPLVNNKDPNKKLVRITLPNGKVFRATITGKMYGDFDNLFAHPTMRSILTGASNEERYNVNYTRVSNANKSNPTKVLGTKIQNLNIRVAGPGTANKKQSTMNNKQVFKVKSNTTKILGTQIQDLNIRDAESAQPIDTVNLISDDEDEAPIVPTRGFTTEFGYYTTTVDEETMTIHQKKFNQTCEVKMYRDDIFKSNKTKPKRKVLLQESSLITRNKSKLLCNVTASKIVNTTTNITPEIVSKTDTSTYIPEVPESTLAQTNNTSTVDTADVIEIDDSSNDGAENPTPKTIGDVIGPMNKLVELKGLLLQDLGVGIEKNIDTNITLPVPKEKAVGNLKSALLQDLGIVTTDSPVIDITAEDEISENIKKQLEQNPTDEENKEQAPADVEKQNDIKQNDEIFKKMFKRQEQETLKKCVVSLVKCDNLIKKYERIQTMKKCYVKLERLNKSILQVENPSRNEKRSDEVTKETNSDNTGEINQDNVEDFIEFDAEDLSGSPQLSRCPSLSILNNWDDDSQHLDIPCPTSPVMEIYETIAQLGSKLKTEMVRGPGELLPLTCDSEWTLTKLGCRFQETLLRSCITPSLEIKNEPDSEKLVTKFYVPELLTIILKFFEDNPDVIYRTESMRNLRRILTTNSPSNKLKRKPEKLVNDTVANKMFKLETLALNSLNSCIEILDGIRFPEIEENVTVQQDDLNIKVECANRVLIESLPKDMTLNVRKMDIDKKSDYIISTSDNESSEADLSDADLVKCENKKEYFGPAVDISEEIHTTLIAGFNKIYDLTEHEYKDKTQDSNQPKKPNSEPFVRCGNKKVYSSSTSSLTPLHRDINLLEENMPINDTGENCKAEEQDPNIKPEESKAEQCYNYEACVSPTINVALTNEETNVYSEEASIPDTNKSLTREKMEGDFKEEQKHSENSYPENQYTQCENKTECLSPVISVPLVDKDTSEEIQIGYCDASSTDHETEEKYSEATKDPVNPGDDISKEQSQPVPHLVTEDGEEMYLSEIKDISVKDHLSEVTSLSSIPIERACDTKVTEENDEVGSPSTFGNEVEADDTESGMSENICTEQEATEIFHVMDKDRLGEILIGEIPNDAYEVEVVDTQVDGGILESSVEIIESLHDKSGEPITNIDFLDEQEHDTVIKSPVFIDTKKITFNYHDYTKQPKNKEDVSASTENCRQECEENTDKEESTKERASETEDTTQKFVSIETPCRDIATNHSEVNAFENCAVKSNPECKYELIQEDDLLTVKITRAKDDSENKSVFVDQNDVKEEIVASPCAEEAENIAIKGFEFEDIYVFPLSQSNSSSNNTSNDSLGQESNIDTVNDTKQNYLHDIDFHVIEPEITYSRKRKICMRDIKVPSKKYRKGKNIDCSKQTVISMSELAYGKEYKRLLEYCSSVKFSYTRPFHKECVEVDDLMSDWPIKKYSYNVPVDIAEEHLFVDLQDISTYQPDPITQTFVEEINYKYDRTDATPENPQSEASEVNFNMGFGERSGRVIQILKKEESNISAATLSDVKQSQPVFKSVDLDDYKDVITNKDDQIKIIRQHVNFIELRDKVRTFFKKSSIELKSDWLQNTKDTDYESKCNVIFSPEDFPFDLCSLDYMKPLPTNAIVQVVQVGQLPVSAAAQNPVTCDPRVTQVSDASPSQCSVDNSPNDDSQSEIKTEYTELTTADLTLPLQGYAQQNQANVASNDSNLELTEQTISLEMEIKAEESPEIKEEMPDIKEEKSNSSDTDLHTLTNATTENMEYGFENNKAKSNVGAAYDSSEQKKSETFSQQRHQNGTAEKTDQIAHAMSAAGITTTPETVTNRAHALVNILSQKIRQGSVNTTQTTTNTYSKTTSINAMALQQALAQILPPPLNQTGSAENNLTQSTPVGPQVLHIVQGKNASGNQITLVDNSQQSVISTPNATQVLHIVQNKNANPGQASNGALTPQSNSFSGLSLVDAGLQQGGNQLLHIVNTGNQKTASSGQLLKRVNLLTNLTNVQGSNEQKMVQFVCKSADGKAIQLNAPHQRSMVLRLQPIETPNVQTPSAKSAEPQEPNPSPTGSASSKESANQQEIKSRSIYEENYAKFIQNSSSKTPGLEKSTSLPKFNQAFGKPVFQEGQKQGEAASNNSHLPAVHTNIENPECPATDNVINLDHIGKISSPPLLLRKQPVVTSASQPNIVQQIKQTIAPMNIQTMHGGVIYTRQIPVNIGGGQTINLITVPSTELINDDSSKTQSQTSQGEIEPSIIKIVPQSQTTTNTDSSPEESNNHASGSSENAQTPQPQPVLTQMRIKLPMLSKAPQMVPGARVVRPSFFQIQRNVIGGANQPVYQQLVLTAAPPLGQQTIRLPQAQASRPVKAPSESQSSSSESQMSTSTLEQLREFDMVLEQVKERSTVQPTANSNSSSFKIHTTSSDTTDGNASSNCSTESSPQQVLYSIGNNHSLNVAYVNRKTAVTTPTTSTFVRSPDSSGIADSPTSSHVQIPHTVTTDSSPTEMSSQSKPAKVGSKTKSKPKSTSNPPNTLKLNSVPPKTSSQKPLEDEQTTQRILYILAEYKEQVENSPDKDKPAPRRRSNPPSNPGSSKRKKSSSSRRSGTREMSPVHGEDTCRTMGSEDSSCGTSQGDCTESCLDSHSPQDSPRKVARKISFDQDLTVTQPRPQPQRNVIVADGQTITVARGTTGKPATAVLMPANYILPVSMVKGGQQIAIVTNRGPKLLTVGGEGGATNALLLQRLIGPAGLKPVLARPGVRHVRLPTAALHNLQAFNLATATTVQPPDSTASPTPGPTPPELVDTRANSSPWTDRDEVKPERGSSPEGSEPWNLPSSADAHEYAYEETVRADNMDRTVLDPIPDRYSPDMEAQRIFDKMFDVDSKKSYAVDSHDDSPRCAYDIDPSDCDDKAYQVVQKKDGSQRQHRLSHVSAAALRHKYAILEHELRLQKSLSEECEDLGVDSPSASELFPEAELLFAASPAHEHNQEHNSHTPQPHQSSIPQPDMDDQIATDHLIPREIDVGLGLGDVGIVAVSEDGSATIALDQEEFARSHPNTTFHSEPTEGEVQPFTITGLKGRHITSTIFHSNSAPATVLMTAPQATVISQAPDHSVKYEIENMIHSMPSSHNNDMNLSSVLVKDDGLTRFDNILTDSRELHLTNTASAIVHSSGNATQVIRRVCYEDDKRERDARYLIDEPDNLIAGDDAKMIAEDSSRDATLESMADVDDDRSSPERHAELFWESNSASERSESRRPLDFSSDSDKCCKSPSFDETNSTDSSGVGTHMRLDSVIKEARGRERSGSLDGSSADDTHPPLRTYPPKRLYHPVEGAERSLSGKTRAGERSPDSLEVRRRASGRGVVKRGCHCCNGEPAPPRAKKPRQRKPTLDFNATN